MAKYLITFSEGSTRDIQIAETPEADVGDDEGWFDFEGEVVAGVYEAETTGKALRIAAEDRGVSAEQLVAYPLKEEE
jgi:hypothetical protein